MYIFRKFLLYEFVTSESHIRRACFLRCCDNIAANSRLRKYVYVQTSNIYNKYILYMIDIYIHVRIQKVSDV